MKILNINAHRYTECTLYNVQAECVSWNDCTWPTTSSQTELLKDPSRSQYHSAGKQWNPLYCRLGRRYYRNHMYIWFVKHKMVLIVSLKIILSCKIGTVSTAQYTHSLKNTLISGFRKLKLFLLSNQSWKL